MTATIVEVSSGHATGLDLDDSGVPRSPIRLVDLDRPATTNEIAAAAECARSSLAILVGVARSPIDHAVRPLVEALTTTVVPDELPTRDGLGVEASRHIVRVLDLDAAVTDLLHAASQSPRAAVVLAQVLRHNTQVDVRAALATEAAAYSMLLAGDEFASWLAARGAPRPPHVVAEPVGIERNGDLLTISLQRPGRRNAMDAALRESLVEALTVAIADPAVDVVVTGAGPDFCSGGDLDEFGTARDAVAAYLVRLDRHPGWLLHRLRERTTVQVHGACIGAGIELPAFAGRIIAEQSAGFALPEVSMGLIPGAGGTVSIPRRIGRWRTAWLALTGARLDATRAHRWGLVDEVIGE